MATKLYLRTTRTHPITDTGDVQLYDMLPVAGASADFNTQMPSTEGGTQIQFTRLNGDTVAWISGRVPSGGFTLTTTDVDLWLFESVMTANASGRYRVYRYQPGPTITELGGGPFDDGVEFPTTLGSMTWAGNVTDTAFAENDRILLRVYAIAEGTMHAGTVQLACNAADGTDGDSFFNIAETVAFKAEGGEAPPPPRPPVVVLQAVQRAYRY